MNKQPHILYLRTCLLDGRGLSPIGISPSGQPAGIELTTTATTATQDLVIRHTPGSELKHNKNELPQCSTIDRLLAIHIPPRPVQPPVIPRSDQQYRHPMQRRTYCLTTK